MIYYLVNYLIMEMVLEMKSEDLSIGNAMRRVLETFQLLSLK